MYHHATLIRKGVSIQNFIVSKQMIVAMHAIHVAEYECHIFKLNSNSKSENDNYAIATGITETKVPKPGGDCGTLPPPVVAFTT